MFAAFEGYSRRRWRPPGPMRDLGKLSLLGVLVDALDYEAAVERTILAATERRPFAASALAVHGVMTGVRDDVFRYRLNHLDLLTPDGQPVRWGLNLLYHVHLDEQVRGTAVMIRVLERAAAEGLPVYFYGSRSEVLQGLVASLRGRLPELVIAGTEPGRFRLIGSNTKAEIAERISGSGARIAFVGLGCPRQEVFVHEFRDLLAMPLLAVGAAFDYLAGFLPEPPERLRRSGLEWLWRLALEPRRLWRRYLLLNPAYLTLLTLAGTRHVAPGFDRGSSPRDGTTCRIGSSHPRHSRMGQLELVTADVAVEVAKLTQQSGQNISPAAPLLRRCSDGAAR